MLQSHARGRSAQANRLLGPPCPPPPPHQERTATATRRHSTSIPLQKQGGTGCSSHRQWACSNDPHQRQGSRGIPSAVPRSPHHRGAGNDCHSRRAAQKNGLTVAEDHTQTMRQGWHPPTDPRRLPQRYAQPAASHQGAPANPLPLPSHPLAATTDEATWEGTDGEREAAASRCGEGAPSRDVSARYRCPTRNSDYLGGSL